MEEDGRMDSDEMEWKRDIRTYFAEQIIGVGREVNIPIQKIRACRIEEASTHSTCSARAGA